MALIQTGQITTSGTPQPLSPTRVQTKKWFFKAPASNGSQQVFYGPAGVTTSTGMVMDAGDDVEIDQTIGEGAVYEVTPGDVYVVGTGGIVSWAAFE